MRRLFLSIIIVCVSISSTVGVFAEAPTEEQVNELREYSVMVGDPDGNMRFEDTLTRAEAVKLIYNLSGFGEKGIYASNEQIEQSPMFFPDVSQIHWASEYITWAKTSGIVEGDEKGNFNPEKPVTNEEFIKMLVSSLGYSPLAESRGGFPAGFIKIATDRGITKGLQFAVNTPAKRGDVAVMICSSFDVPLMKQNGFGDAVSFVIMDGSNGTKLQTLRDNFKK